MNTDQLNAAIKAKFATTEKLNFTEEKTSKPERLTQIEVKPERNDKATQLINLLNEMVTPSAPQIDEDTIRQLIKEEISKQEPRKLEINYNGVKHNLEGLIHHQFEDILKACSARLNVWLTGTAGAGKTTTAAKVAKALNLEFYSVSVCAQTTESRLFGYNDANGRYIETVFYKAYKEGGIFLLDEIDNGNPNILAALNCALSTLAKEKCSFPCGMVEKHPDFICIAAANTIGTGGNIKYVGRNPIDKATLDRFIFIHFEIDENIEKKLSIESFTLKVQELRRKAELKGMNVIISPRASINGSKLIEAGFTEAQALEMTIFNKCTQEEKNQLKN